MQPDEPVRATPRRRADRRVRRRVERFSANGQYQGIVGRTRLKEGCKPVAIAFWPRDNRLYLADVVTSRIVVLSAVAPTGR